MTSVGALISYNGPGRLLTQLYPDGSVGYGGAVATSKDHTYVDTATAWAYTISLGDIFDP